MIKLINKNLIVLFAVFALILSFSVAKTVSARTLTIDFGASNTLTDQNDYNNNYNYSNNNQNNNQNVVPVITSLSSSYGTSGSSGKAITVNGYNFIPSSVARWNGSDRNTSFINSNQLVMYTTDYDMNNLGTNAITVYNHAPNGGISNNKNFVINKPVISSSTTTNTSNTTTKKTASTATTKKANSTVCSTGSTSDNNDNTTLAANAFFGSTNGFLPSTFLQWMLLAIIILLIVMVWRKVSGATQKYHEKPLKHA